MGVVIYATKYDNYFNNEEFLFFNVIFFKSRNQIIKIKKKKIDNINSDA